MPQNIITEKFKDIYPGQILAHYKFFQLQIEDSFSYYKNEDNLFLFIFYTPQNELRFLETLEFKVLDKLELFYFLAQKLDMDSLLNNLKDIMAVEEYDKFNFTESITSKELLDYYFRLEHTDYLIGTPLEKFAFRRDGSDVIIFKDLNNKPIDVVSFIDNKEEVTSEFGNNFGAHFFRNESSDTVMLSFHPKLIYLDENRENFNVLITKYNTSLIDVISVLKKEKLFKIEICVAEKYSYIYKLQILLKFFNFFSTNISFDLNISSNLYFAELYFNLQGSTLDKLEVTKQVAGFQNSLKKLLANHSENIKDAIYESFNFRVEIFSEGNNHCGKIVFRNNISLLNIIIESFQMKINEFTNCDYKFV